MKRFSTPPGFMPASSPTRPSAARCAPPITRPPRTCSPRPVVSSGLRRSAGSANPTRSALERALGESRVARVGLLEAAWRPSTAHHRGLRGRRSCSLAPPPTTSTADVPPRRQGPPPTGGCATPWSTTDLDAVEEPSSSTLEYEKLIWVETPTNPTLKVDIEQIVARRRNALVAVDNTFATPV